MADYCYQCTEKHLGVDGKENDLQDLSTPEDTAQGLFPLVICEGCGPTQVNDEGRCISSDCLEDGHVET